MGPSVDRVTPFSQSIRLPLSSGRRIPRVRLWTVTPHNVHYDVYCYFGEWIEMQANEEFGPPRKSLRPELPFYHLQIDGVWDIEERIPLTRRKRSKNPRGEPNGSGASAAAFPPRFRRIRIVTFIRGEVIRRDVTNDNPEVFAYIKSPNGAAGGLTTTPG